MFVGIGLEEKRRGELKLTTEVYRGSIYGVED